MLIPGLDNCYFIDHTAVSHLSSGQILCATHEDTVYNIIIISTISNILFRLIAWSWPPAPPISGSCLLGEVSLLQGLVVLVTQ